MADGGNFLKLMAEASKDRVAEAKRRVPEDDIRRKAVARPPAPPLELDSRGFDVIGEIKLESPSAGKLDEAAGDVAARASAYAEAGAAAVSVLTEPSRFGGDMEHLSTAAAALDAHRIPAMRKDFLVDSYQVHEARAAGAGGVLIIVRMLDDAQIQAMLATAIGLGMFVLLEAFDTGDLDRMGPLTHDLPAPATVLAGLNSRNLETLEVDPTRLEKLAGLFPPGLPRVAESGIATAKDARAAAVSGYSLALVGTALMHEADPGALIGDMLAAGRAAS